MTTWKAELWLLFVTIIWGTSYLFAQIGLDYCSPSMYVVMRFAITLLVLLMFWGKQLKGIDKRTLKQGSVIGVLFGAGFILQTFALKYTTVPKTAFISGLLVCTVPFVYWFIERRPIKIWHKLGVIIATGGLFIFTKPDFNNINIGDVLALISAVIWGYYICYLDIYTRDDEDSSRTSPLVLLNFLVALPIAIATLAIFDADNMTVTWSTPLWVSLLYNAIITSIVATFLQFYTQKYSTPVKAALIFSLEPIVATATALVYYGEALKSYEIIGGIIMMSGVLLSELMPSSSRKRKEIVAE